MNNGNCFSFQPARRSMPALLASLLLAATTPAVLAATASSPLGDARELASQWLALERQQQQISQQWQQEKAQLELRIDLLTREREQLQTAISSHDGEDDAVAEARAELLVGQQALEAEQLAVGEFTRYQQHLAQALLPSLPPPVASAWRERIDSLGEDDKASSTLQTYLELFGMLEDFQRLTTLTQGLIALDDGRELYVTQLYLGASHGWYISADGAHRGTGYAGREAWIWQEDHSLDPAALRVAIDALENRNPAALVSLPVRLAPEVNPLELADIDHAQ
ncbi:MAG: DUF3450 family protein [Parahaliea sp.]